jgi:hypothetical protein
MGLKSLMPGTSEDLGSSTLAPGSTSENFWCHTSKMHLRPALDQAR